MKKIFKSGQWLIRRWAKENGGETDFVRFYKPINEKRFQYSKFYRISKNKIENIASMDKDNSIEYTDHRMSLQFRLATKSEIQKYSTKIMCFS